MSEQDKVKIVEDIIRSYCQGLQVDWEDIPEMASKIAAVWLFEPK